MGQIRSRGPRDKGGEPQREAQDIRPRRGPDRRRDLPGALVPWGPPDATTNQQIREIRRCERSSFCPSPKVGASEAQHRASEAQGRRAYPAKNHHTRRSGGETSHAVSELAATNREPNRTACRILDGKLSQRAAPHNEPGEAASHAQGPDDDERPRRPSKSSWALQHSITSSPVRDVFQSRTFEASRGSELDDFS